jgi:hypothetical protein
VVFVVSAAVHPGSSSAVMFTTMEHLASASGTAAIASEIGALHFNQHLRLIHLQWLEKLIRL